MSELVKRIMAPGDSEREYYWGPLSYLFTFPALGGLLFGYDIVRMSFRKFGSFLSRVRHPLSLSKLSLVIIQVD